MLKPTAPTESPVLSAKTSGLSFCKYALEVKAGMKQEVFTLNEGNVVLQWPDRMSLESLQDFEDWWNIVLRKVKRAATAPKGNPSPDETEAD